jgi:hypothetical protein
VRLPAKIANLPTPYDELVWEYKIPTPVYDAGAVSTEGETLTLTLELEGTEGISPEDVMAILIKFAIPEENIKTTDNTITITITPQNRQAIKLDLLNGPTSETASKSAAGSFSKTEADPTPPTAATAPATAPQTITLFDMVFVDAGDHYRLANMQPLQFTHALARLQNSIAKIQKIQSFVRKYHGLEFDLKGWDTLLATMNGATQCAPSDIQISKSSLATTIELISNIIPAAELVESDEATPHYLPAWSERASSLFECYRARHPEAPTEALTGILHTAGISLLTSTIGQTEDEEEISFRLCPERFSFLGMPGGFDFLPTLDPSDHQQIVHLYQIPPSEMARDYVGLLQALSPVPVNVYAEHSDDSDSSSSGGDTEPYDAFDGTDTPPIPNAFSFEFLESVGLILCRLLPDGAVPKFSAPKVQVITFDWMKVNGESVPLIEREEGYELNLELLKSTSLPCKSLKAFLATLAGEISDVFPFDDDVIDDTTINLQFLVGSLTITELPDEANTFLIEKETLYAVDALWQQQTTSRASAASSESADGGAPTLTRDDSIGPFQSLRQKRFALYESSASSSNSLSLSVPSDGGNSLPSAPADIQSTASLPPSLEAAFAQAAAANAAAAAAPAASSDSSSSNSDEEDSQANRRRAGLFDRKRRVSRRDDGADADSADRDASDRSDDPDDPDTSAAGPRDTKRARI